VRKTEGFGSGAKNGDDPLAGGFGKSGRYGVTHFHKIRREKYVPVGKSRQVEFSVKDKRFNRKLGAFHVFFNDCRSAP